MKRNETRHLSLAVTHLSYLPFTELPNLCDTFAEHSCDNAPNEKGIRWNQLMYW